jgi:hypothetical protein
MSGKRWQNDGLGRRERDGVPSLLVLVRHLPARRAYRPGATATTVLTDVAGVDGPGLTDIPQPADDIPSLKLRRGERPLDPMTVNRCNAA